MLSYMLCASCGAKIEDTCACGDPSLLNERYQLDEVVGRGAMGVTYRARDEAGQIVAVKELPLRSADDLKTWEMFEREARVLRELDHPNIPRYLDDFVWGTGKHSAIYIVQEYVDGETLLEEIRTKRHDENAALEVINGILPILEYLHHRTPPVIHRDLKPGNVIRRSSDGQLVLIDFGSVRDVLKDTRLGGSTVTGTFGYMAPEQFRGRAVPATDLYGLGALLLTLLTRNEPQELLDHYGQPEWRKLRFGIRPLNLLRALLEPDLKKRAKSVTEVRDVMARESALFVPERRGHSVSVALVGLICAVLGIGLTWFYKRVEHAEEKRIAEVAQTATGQPRVVLPPLDGELVILPGDAPKTQEPLLLRKQVYEVLSQRGEAIDRCYRQLLMHRLDLMQQTLKVDISFVTGAEGKIEDLSILLPPEIQGEQTIRTCLDQQLRDLSFPKTRGGQPARVNVPLYLLPTAESDF